MKIAAVRYLNTAPLITGLDAWAGAQIIRAVPSQIADMVLTGQADIGLASIIDYTHSQSTPDPLVLIPAGMIGCDGPTLTVKLLSAVPINEIKTVHADTDSHTSVILSKIILSKVHGITPQYINHTIPDSADHDQPETLLMIGDKVVTASPPESDYPYQLDLGQAWHDLTGLPFVYATWMCRQSSVSEPESRGRIIAAAHILERMMLKNKTRIDWIVETHAPAAGWTTELARHYIGDLLRFQVDERATEAVESFLTMAADYVNSQETGGAQARPHWLDLSQSSNPHKAPVLTP